MMPIVADSPTAVRGCRVDGCARRHYAKDLCNTHYARQRSGLPVELSDEQTELNRRRKSADSKRGQKRTPEQRARIAAGTARAWSEGKYDDTDFSVAPERRAKIAKSVRARWDDGSYDKTDQSYRTPEFRARHSEKMKTGGHRPPVQAGPLSEEHKAKIGAAHRGMKRPPRSEDHRKKLGDARRRAWRRGEGVRGTVFTPYLRADGSTVQMRSGAELIFARQLDGLSIEWQYEPRRFDLGWCTYAPDFYLPEYDRWVEIKGFFRRTDEHQRIVSLATRVKLHLFMAAPLLKGELPSRDEILSEASLATSVLQSLGIPTSPRRGG